MGREQRGLWLAAAAALLVLAVVLGARYVVRSHPPRGTSTDASASVQVYYAGRTSHGVRLFPESHPVGGVDSAQTAMAAVSSEPLEDDYFSALPDGCHATVVSDGAIPQLRISGSNAPLPAGVSARLAVQAVVFSFNAGSGSTAPVRVDAGSCGALRRLDLSQPVVRDLDALSPMWIESPGWGDSVTSPVTMQGSIESDGGAGTWTLVGPSGPVRSGTLTPTPSQIRTTFSVTTSVPPGRYTAQVSASGVTQRRVFFVVRGS